MNSTVPHTSRPHRPLVFVGGVHGVGKSTRCERWAEMLPALHYTASQLIGHAPLPADPRGKAVADLGENQHALVTALGEVAVGTEALLLDGHFCIYTGPSSFSPIPVDVFRHLEPSRLLLLEDEVAGIAHRLHQRDGSRPAKSVIAAELAEERRHAVLISESLQVPLMMVAKETTDPSVVGFLRSEDRVRS